jgi:hypothetical protein
MRALTRQVLPYKLQKYPHNFIMATEGYVKFEYHSRGVPPYYNNGSFPELLDDENIIIKTPILEMNYHQYFGLFKKFLMSVGFNEKNIMQGACHLAFNEMNDEKTMREVAEEYDLTMNENIPEIIADSKKQDEEWIQKTNESWEQRYWALYRRFEKFACYSDDDLQKMIDLYDADQVKQDLISVSEFLSQDRNSNFPGENTIEEPMTDKVKRGYDYWEEDTSNQDMLDEGMMKVSTNIPEAWNGLVPGSPEARAAGCICPVLDNEEMPDDKKWIDVACPIHGKKS